MVTVAGLECDHSQGDGQWRAPLTGINGKSVGGKQKSISHHQEQLFRSSDSHAAPVNQGQEQHKSQRLRHANFDGRTARASPDDESERQDQENVDLHTPQLETSTGVKSGNSKSRTRPAASNRFPVPGASADAAAIPVQLLSGGKHQAASSSSNNSNKLGVEVKPKSVRSLISRFNMG